MTRSDDDQEVNLFFRRDERSLMDSQDAAVLRAAAEVLRALEPDRPPTASLELAALLAAGTAKPNLVKTRTRAAVTRFAGLGVAAKVILAAGVAIAGVGGAATAVALSTGHFDSHPFGHHGSRHPRNSASLAPHPSATTADHDGSAKVPGSDDVSPEPSTSGEHEPGDRPGRNGGAHGGHGHGQGGRDNRDGNGHGGGQGRGDNGGRGDGHGGGPGSGDGDGGGHGSGHGGGPGSGGSGDGSGHGGGGDGNGGSGGDDGGSDG